VKVHGDFLPRCLFGGLYIVFAILRSLYLALVILFAGVRYDVIVSDQLSVSIPILRLTGAKILFYCHFPDKLLSQRTGSLKKLYRAPVDWVEERTTAQADRIVVNSKFTASIFKQAFKTIGQTPEVLYPPINLAAYDKSRPLSPSSPFAIYQTRPKKLVISFNRFERKKNINLAVQAFAELGKTLPTAQFQELQLVVAGGYDTRVRENVEHHLELATLATSLGLTHQTLQGSQVPSPEELQSANVIFLPSFSEEQRSYLLANSLCLLYTPSNEHFGIVPCEAMYSRLPVIAVNNGGPTESVVNGVTGLLVDADPKSFASGISKFLSGELNRKEMGEKGRQRVKDKFSLEAFTDHLDNILTLLASERAKKE